MGDAMSVSVVIPARNEESLIAEALESIARQTRSPAEVILVDDGSTDRTVEVARKVMPSLRIVMRPPLGAAAATNYGIREASEPLLAFVDADDLWTPDKLELQLSILEADPEVAAVLGHVESFVCPRADGHAFRVPEKQAGWSLCALLIRRETFERVGSFAENLHIGYGIDWFDRARRQNVRFELPEQTVFHRRLRPGSLSQQPADKHRGYLEIAHRAIRRRREARPDQGR